ncbi:hypothetical protein OAS39_11570, partial [Pirellulales bacterium]|nr:hypothetical protein [Pirellulales bacterium]
MLNLLLQDAGLPHGFVYGYAAPTMLCAPAWICFCGIAFALGLRESKWTAPATATFLLAIPVAYAIPECFTGHLLQLNYRVVPLIGMVLATVSYLAARRLAKRAGVFAALGQDSIYALLPMSAFALFL